MVKEEMFDPLMFLIQTEKGELMEKINIPLLEIFYHTFTCFDYNFMYSNKESINFAAEAYRNSTKRDMAARHSRFMPNFMMTTSTGVNRLRHKVAD
jgi:hypothetical protein